jgi:CubicO group peptidase (beta-lactamase class C family)
VLNHTTGFPNWRQGEDLPIEFDPGTRSQYSGEGFSYLQSVVEEITHKSFADFMHDDVLKPLGMSASRVTYDEGTAYARLVAGRHDKNGQRIPGNPATPQRRAEDMARYGAAASLSTTPTDYASFLLEFLAPKPADAFRLNAASRAEMLRPQVKKSDDTFEGLAWHLEQIQGIPMLFSHAGSADGWYCMTSGCLERRSGLMVMLNGDAYIPFLLRMLADPSGRPSPPEELWPDFAKRFFAAA